MKQLKLWTGSLLLAAMIGFSGNVMNVSAAPASSSVEEENGIPYVSDRAGLLSYDEWQALEEKAKQVSEQYECGVYIVTVDNYEDYSDASVYEAAKFIYTANELGYGADKDGELLLLSMQDRDYSLIAYGYGNTAFTDYGKEVLEKKFLDDFGDNEWYDGFEDYIEQSATMLSMAREGEPLDVGYRAPEPGWVNALGTILSGILGLIVTLIVGTLLKGQLKSVHQKVEAGNYVTKNGINISTRQDQFINRTTTRRKIEKSNSSSGGTSVDSGGFSGSSGKF